MNFIKSVTDTKNILVPIQEALRFEGNQEFEVSINGYSYFMSTEEINKHKDTLLIALDGAYEAEWTRRYEQDLDNTIIKIIGIRKKIHHLTMAIGSDGHSSNWAERVTKLGNFKAELENSNLALGQAQRSKKELSTCSLQRYIALCNA
jgi:hypothetical protein